MLQNSGDIRSGIYCTFYLSVNVFDNAIYVKGCSTHFGHQIETLIPSPPRIHTQTQASSTSGDESLNVEENQNICPVEEEDAKSEQLVIVEDEQIFVNDRESKATPDFQRELRRIALDIQTEAELFHESEAILSPAEFQQLERASAVIVEILRASRGRPALLQLNTENEQSSPPTQTTRFNSTGAIMPVASTTPRHSTASLPTQRQLTGESKSSTPTASIQTSQLHQQFLQQQQLNSNTIGHLPMQLPPVSLTNGLSPQTALLLAATAQQRAMVSFWSSGSRFIMGGIPGEYTFNFSVIPTLPNSLLSRQTIYLQPWSTSVNNNNWRCRIMLTFLPRMPLCPCWTTTIASQPLSNNWLSWMQETTLLQSWMTCSGKQLQTLNNEGRLGRPLFRRHDDLSRIQND